MFKGTVSLIRFWLAAGMLALNSCAKAPMTEIVTIPVQKGDVDIRLTIGGRIESAHQISITAPDDLTVQELLVSNGQKVFKGTTLAKLNPEKVQELIRNEELRLSHSQSQHRASTIRLEGLNRDFRRAGRLLASGAISREEREKLSQELEIQKSQLVSQTHEKQSISANIARLNAQAQFLNLTANFDSIVTYQWVAKDAFIPGSSVKKGDLLFRLSSEGKMILRSTLREEDVAYFAAGQKLPIRFPALPGITAEARVSFVDSAATIDKEGGVGTFRVYLEFTPPPEVKTGMEAMIEVVPQKKEGVLTIPKTAINPINENGYEVMVVEASTKSRRKVEIGLIGDSRVEVISGLTAGQKVMAKYEE